MRFLRLILLAGFLTACGGVTATPSPTGPTPAPTATPTPTPRPTPSPSPTPAVINQACADELGDLRDTLDQLDARLDIGLTYSDYSDRVGDISVANNRVDVEGLGDMGGAICVGVALKLTEAFLAYIDAHDIWQSCIERTSCSTSSIEPQLQAKWADASDLLDEAGDQFP